MPTHGTGVGFAKTNTFAVFSDQKYVALTVGDLGPGQLIVGIELDGSQAALTDIFKFFYRSLFDNPIFGRQ